MRTARMLTTLTALAALTFGVFGNALAQTPTDPGKTLPKRERRAGKLNKHRDGAMASLNLTPEQKAKIKAIMQARKAERQKTQAELDAVLTPEQREKLATMKEQKKAQHQSRKGAGKRVLPGSPNPTP